MNDLRIKYTKPTIIEVTYVDSDVVLVQLSDEGGQGGSGFDDPFGSNKSVSSDSDDNSGNGEGFEYNPFQ